jgi:uroporphyrin-III C-methyltransferase/precorrin-2 dehydrogenase/sirohydrochlorin ferrochelatase
VRGRRELLTADVVVHDRLAPLDLLALLDPDVEVIDASKAPGAHELSQDDINAVLVDRARRGLRVARLKGGDPFVLGRGGEEVLACVEAGVPVEVVPGVSSALAAPSAAGIPVTHRTVSPGFVVITGHDLDEVDALAGTNLTVVILMGVGRLAAIAARLQAQGRSATTPVAIVERATSPDQRVTVATLSTISSVAREAGVQNPAVIVVGEVVGIPALADALAPDANPSPADANAPAPAGRGLTPDAVAAEV